jgi:uncharacterized protein (DUF305 family)
MAGSDHSHAEMQTEMDSMMGNLAGKTGEASDEAFLRGMIVHHEGAVEMAKRVQQDGAHRELKDMADEVVAVQSREIETMRRWLKDWGYER